jgi:hypothetical protein
MKNLYLSDAHYLEDFDSILSQLFNRTPLNQQPKFIIEIGCGDGYLLKHAYQFIKDKTLRGKSLSEYPLECVPLILEEGAIESIRRKLADIPHRTSKISDLKSETIQSALLNLRILDLTSSLFLNAFPQVDESFQPYSILNNTFGIINLQIHRDEPSLKASDYLLKAAMSSWFPIAGSSYSYPESNTFVEFTLNHFQFRPYIIRNASLEDLPQVMQLEELCWGNELSMSENTIINRITKYKEGQFVLEWDQKIAGIIYSQLISDRTSLDNVPASEVDTLHNPEGKIIDILSLNIHPEKQKNQLGGNLLEFILQISSLNHNITDLVGVTRCKNYPGNEKISIETYIHEKLPNGLPIDPVLRLHAQHGGIVTKVIPNYRPLDKKNLGFGVLIVYPWQNRTLHLKSSTVSQLSKISEWIYQIEWRETEPPKKELLPLDRVWIIFADEREKIAHGLREVLKEQRQYCIIVQSGTQFEKISESSYVVNPLSPEDIEKLFSSISNTSQLGGVIYLWGYISTGTLTPSISTLQNWHSKSCSGLISIANAIDALELSSLCPVWIISQSTVNDGNIESLAQSPLSNLSKVISEEYLRIPCCYLAIDPEESEKQICECIFNEISFKFDKPKDSQISWKNGKRFVPRFSRSVLDNFAKTQYSSEATYLVAGGFSALGLIMINRYIANGAKHIVILDENNLAPDKADKLAELVAKGVSITPYVVKFDDEAALKNIFTQIQQEHPPLKGLIQTVPLLEDELLRHTQWENFENMYRMRVIGSWHLHQLTKDLSLDHFILFSSIITHFAPAGKANQAIATSFLEALSYYRKKQNLPSLTIDWGIWGIKHVIVKHVIETRQLKERLDTFTIEEALEAFEQVVQTSTPNIIVAKVKWPIVKAQQSPENHLFDEIQ